MLSLAGRHLPWGRPQCFPSTNPDCNRCAEIDYSGLDINDSRDSGVTNVVSFPSLTYQFGNTLDLDSQWSLRGRLGYASGQHLFVSPAFLETVRHDADFNTLRIALNYRF